MPPRLPDMTRIWSDWPATCIAGKSSRSTEHGRRLEAMINFRILMNFTGVACHDAHGAYDSHRLRSSSSRAPDTGPDCEGDVAVSGGSTAALVRLGCTGRAGDPVTPVTPGQAVTRRRPGLLQRISGKISSHGAFCCTRQGRPSYLHPPTGRASWRPVDRCGTTGRREQ